MSILDSVSEVSTASQPVSAFAASSTSAVPTSRPVSGYDLHGINSEMIDAIGQAFLDYGINAQADKRINKPRSADGVSTFQQIVSRNKTGGNLRVVDEGLIAKGHTRKRIEAICRKGEPQYCNSLDGFHEALDEHYLQDPERVSYETSLELMRLAGVTDIARIQVGSVFDAAMSSLLKEFAKAPTRFALGVGFRSVMNGMVQAGTSTYLYKPAIEPGRATTRVLLTGALQSLSNTGVNGRFVRPTTEDYGITKVDIHRLRQVLLDQELVEELERKRSPTLTCAKFTEIELRKAVEAKLWVLLATEQRQSAAAGIDSRRHAAIAMAIATASAQIVASISAGIALSAISLGPVAGAVALIVYPLMAAGSKCISNRQDIEAIARDALLEYEKLRCSGKPIDDKAIASIAKYFQDHVQSADQANYQRRIENVFLPQLAQKAMLIVKRAYRIDQLEELAKSCSDAELRLIEKAQKQRERIQAHNINFRPGEYLACDCAAVEILIGYASDKNLSDETFLALLGRHSPALMTLQAASDENSANVFAEFKDAYEKRMGKAIRQEDLEECYYNVIQAIRDTLYYADKARRLPAYAALSFPQSGVESVNNHLRYRYLQDNYQLIEARTKDEKKLVDIEAQLNTVRLNRSYSTDPNFFEKKEKLKIEHAQLDEKNNAAMRSHRLYESDVKSYQKADGGINPKGKLLRQIDSNDWGVMQAIKFFVQYNIPVTLKQKLLGQIAIGIGYSTPAAVMGYSINQERQERQQRLERQERQYLASRLQSRLALDTQAIDEVSELIKSRRPRATNPSEPLRKIHKLKTLVEQKRNEIAQKMPSPEASAKFIVDDKKYHEIQKELSAISWWDRVMSKTAQERYDKLFPEMEKLADVLSAQFGKTWELNVLHRQYLDLVEKLKEAESELADMQTEDADRAAVIEQKVLHPGYVDGVEHEDLYFTLLDEARALPPIHAGGVASALISRLDTLSAGLRGDAFAKILTLVVSLRDGQKEQNLAKLIRTIRVLAPEDRYTAFAAAFQLFDSLKDSVSSNSTSELCGALTGELHSLPDENLYAAFELCNTHPELAGAKSILAMAELLPRQYRRDALSGLAAAIKELPVSARPAFYKSLVESAGKLEIADKNESFLRLSREIKHLPIADRLTSFKAMLKWGGALTGAQLAVSSALASQLAHLPQADIVAAFDSYRTAFPKVTATAAFDTVISDASLLSVEENGARIKVWISLIDKQPEKERFGACVRLWKAMGKLGAAQKSLITERMFKLESPATTGQSTTGESAADSASSSASKSATNSSLLSELRGRVKNLHIDIRGAAFELLMAGASTLVGVDRGAHHEWIANSIRQLPKSARLSCAMSLILSASLMPGDDRRATLRELGRQIPYLPESERKAVFDSILQSIGKPPLMERAQEVRWLTRQIRSLPETSRSAAFESTRLAIALLPESQKSACIAELALNTVVLPSANRFDAFDKLLRMASPLPEASRTEILEALHTQIRTLPGAKQHDAFDMCVALSLGMVSVRHVEKIPATSGMDQPRGPEIKTKAYDKITYSDQKTWLKRPDGSLYINNLILQIPLMSIDSRTASLNSVIAVIAAMKSSSDKSVPLAMAGMQLGSLKDADQDAVLKSVVDIASTFPLKERLRFGFSLVCMVDAKLMPELFRDLIFHIKATPAGSRLDPIHAAILVLPSMSANTLFAAAKQVEECFKDYTPAQMLDPDVVALRNAFSAATANLTPAQRSEFTILPTRPVRGAEGSTDKVEAVTTPPVLVPVKFTEVFNLNTTAFDPATTLNRTTEGDKIFNDSPSYLDGELTKRVQTDIIDKPPSEQGSVFKIEGSAHEFVPVGAEYVVSFPEPLPNPASKPLTSAEPLPVIASNLEKIVFIADTRTPTEVGKEGFVPTGKNAAFTPYVEGDKKGSAYVSVSGSAEMAASYGFASDEGGKTLRTYLYEIEPEAGKTDNWFDVAERYPEKENVHYAVKGGIGMDRIVRVHLIERNPAGSPEGFTVLETYERKPPTILAKASGAPGGSSVPNVIKDATGSPNVALLRGMN